jgi:methionine-gamma-lyase
MSIDASERVRTASGADLHPETRAVHVGVPDVAGARPLAVPLYQTSGFAFDDPDLFTESLSRPDGPFGYTRHSNPTVRVLEDAIADLEGGCAGLATSSGMAAINTVLLGLLRPGDHIIAQRRVYGGTVSVFASLAERCGVEVSYVGGDDPAEVKAALRPSSKILYLETISNPTVSVSDLPAMITEGRAGGLLSVVDNTFASPLLCQPLHHGADIVIHSTTKYLAGHSDVTGGIAVFADAELHRRTWKYAVELGTTADPFAAWLTLRGLRTLPLRMQRHCDNAEYLAQRFASHAKIEKVYWPGLSSDPSHTVAKRLLRGYGGVLAIDLVGGRDAGRAFIIAIRLAALAPSLGGVETLVLHPASTSHRQLDAAALAAAGIGEGTVRVAVGLEHPADLWADFEQALAQH